VTHRLTQLDGLRGVAAVMVMLFHFTTRYDQIFMFQHPPALGMPYGGLGVSLFFAISGYVIFMTLDRVRTAREFLASRFSRLYPVFWVCVLITWLLWRALDWPGMPTGLRALVLNLTMLPQQFDAPLISGVYWSLRDELFFYLWMLLLWQLGWLQRPARFIGAWLMLAALALVVQHATGISVPYSAVMTLLLNNIPWFMLGVLIYVHQHQRIGTGVFAVLILLAGVCATLNAGHYTGWPAALCTICTVLALYLAARGKFALAGHPLLVFLGAISYPLYLIHEPFGWVVLHTLDNAGLPASLSIACAIALAIALATLLHKAVEMPAMRWLRARLSPRSSSAAAAVLPATPLYAGATACLAVIGALGLAPRVMAQAKPATPSFSLHQAAPAQHQPCTGATGMLVVLGQSNAGSHAQTGTASTTQGVRSFFNGHCAMLQDPLPGTTGNGASIWTALANSLSVTSRSSLLIAPLAVESTAIAQWVQPGPVHTALRTHLAQVAAANLPVHAVLWQQGETDMRNATEAAHYLRDVVALRTLLDAHGIRAPLLTATSTRCRTTGTGNVRRALARVHAQQPIKRVLPGPDTDALSGQDRIDQCHLSDQGRSKAAVLWLAALRQHGVQGF
jgi:peptidoglycan/LPS O-acetylase OafA/YrhL